MEPIDPMHNERLGSGATSVVYRGFVRERTHGHTQWPRMEVAVKVLKCNPKSLDEKKQFISEATLPMKLNSPTLMLPLNFNAGPKLWYIVTSRARCSLDSVIKDEAKGVSMKWTNSSGQTVQWNDTKRFICAYGIAVGLCTLHENKMIHRDIKPANVLLDENMHPKLSDFGLMRRLPKDGADMTQNVGTPLYIAPEIWNGSFYSESVDVYAYGMLVYELLTLEAPFRETRTIAGLRKMVLSGERPEISAYVSPEWATLITSCWQEDPAKRPTMRKIVETLTHSDKFIPDYVDFTEFDEYRTSVYTPKEKVTGVC